MSRTTNGFITSCFNLARPSIYPRGPPGYLSSITRPM